MSRSTWACELKYGWGTGKGCGSASRSTWACELKWKFHISYKFLLWSRSTWACELKSNRSIVVKSGWKVTLHVSVWVEMAFFALYRAISASRSTWACELKLIVFPSTLNSASHAPRERVSWNTQNLTTLEAKWSHAPRERVSWNCMTTSWLTRVVVTLHVSVWVEIFEYNPEICQL